MQLNRWRWKTRKYVHGWGPCRRRQWKRKLDGRWVSYGNLSNLVYRSGHVNFSIDSMWVGHFENFQFTLQLRWMCRVLTFIHFCAGIFANMRKKEKQIQNTITSSAPLVFAPREYTRMIDGVFRNTSDIVFSVRIFFLHCLSITL